MYSTFKRFLLDESGATAIEYGLVAALIAFGVIVTVVTDPFNWIPDKTATPAG